MKKPYQDFAPRHGSRQPFILYAMAIMTGMALMIIIGDFIQSGALECVRIIE